MFIYAGIDEAGYGPMFGPLVIGCTVLGLAERPPEGKAPPLWNQLTKAVCRTLSSRRGRIAVNDSKKLHNTAAGIAHLERGVLSFLALADCKPTCVGSLLDALGETTHRELALPWYCQSESWPWDCLPAACDGGEIAIARNMLHSAAAKPGLQVLGLKAAVVFEDRFNRMVAATRSKASTSFTFVAGHLLSIWQQHAQHHPLVVIDRQSGRTRYRELLSQTIPEAEFTVLEETPQRSAYHLAAAGKRAMTVEFLVEAEQHHMPVALASMTSKYVRELLMARFQHWFTQQAAHIKPTAGYATDARRFLNEIEPLLPKLGIHRDHLIRRS